MLSKNELKYIQSLYHKKQREEERMFIAEGPKLAEEIINSTFKVRQVYALKDWIFRNKDITVAVKEITPAELGRISNLQSPNEVVIVAEQPIDSSTFQLQGNLSLMLDGIQDPGNMGTIIRIADWFGITQIICTNDCVDVYNPKVIQSTMGSIVRVQCWYRDADSLDIPATVPVYGALLQGQDVYTMEKVTQGVLIIGNESKGIREKLRAVISHPVTIPKKGGAESLNAAVATGIILGCMVNARIANKVKDS